MERDYDIRSSVTRANHLPSSLPISSSFVSMSSSLHVLRDCVFIFTHTRLPLHRCICIGVDSFVDFHTPGSSSILQIINYKILLIKNYNGYVCYRHEFSFSHLVYCHLNYF